MINIAICDDDKNIITQLKRHLDEYEGDRCIVTTYVCGEDLLRERKSFNIIFLDISMAGMDGIETAKKIRYYDKNVKIVYVTNFTDYANQAFEVHAFGYLNKPIKKEQIYKQLDEARAYSPEDEDAVMVEFITTEGVVRLAPGDIFYFEYLNRSVRIKAKDKSYIVKGKITTIADYMNKYGFLAPHKSFVVNLYHVKSIRGYDIFMMDGSIIPLSQKKSAEFREHFNIFLENHIGNL